MWQSENRCGVATWRSASWARGSRLRFWRRQRCISCTTTSHREPSVTCWPCTPRVDCCRQALGRHTGCPLHRALHGPRCPRRSERRRARATVPTSRPVWSSARRGAAVAKAGFWPLPQAASSSSRRVPRRSSARAAAAAATAAGRLSPTMRSSGMLAGPSTIPSPPAASRGVWSPARAGWPSSSWSSRWVSPFSPCVRAACRSWSSGLAGSRTPLPSCTRCAPHRPSKGNASPSPQRPRPRRMPPPPLPRRRRRRIGSLFRCSSTCRRSCTMRTAAPPSLLRRAWRPWLPLSAPCLSNLATPPTIASACTRPRRRTNGDARRPCRCCLRCTSIRRSTGSTVKPDIASRRPRLSLSARRAPSSGECRRARPRPLTGARGYSLPRQTGPASSRRGYADRPRRCAGCCWRPTPPATPMPPTSRPSNWCARSCPLAGLYSNSSAKTRWVMPPIGRLSGSTSRVPRLQRSSRRRSKGLRTGSPSRRPRRNRTPPPAMWRAASRSRSRG